VIELRETACGVTLRVVAVPRGGRTTVERVESGELRVRVAAAPVDGAANRALLDYLAELLGVPRHAVELRSGAHNRRKVVLIRGLDAAAVQQRLRTAL
jgi:uncharacterized protein (TIGR00251 family)